MTPLTFLELTDALIHDQAAKAAFAADPLRYLGEHGLAGFSPQEVATAIEHAADALPAAVAARLTPEPPPGLDGMDAVSHQLAQVAAIDPLEAEATWIDHGDPDPGDADVGDLDPGDPDPGDPDPGDHDPGDLDAGDADAGDADVGDLDPGDLDPGDLDLRRPTEVDGLGETHEVDGLGEDHDTLIDAPHGVHLEALDEGGRSADLEFGRGTGGGATAPIGGDAGLDETTSAPTPVEPRPSETMPTSDELENIGPAGDDPGLVAALDETDDPTDDPADRFDDE